MVRVSALNNIEYQKYHINFHIARGAFGRGELPSEEVMDFLHEKRMDGLPQRAFREEVEQSKVTIDTLVRIALSDFVNLKARKAGKVATEDGERDALWLEDDTMSSIRYIITGTKDEDRHAQKSMINVDSQSEGGAYDLNRVRIVVESKKAREFKIQKGHLYLTMEGMKKRKLNRNYIPEYKDLNDRGMAKYRELFKASHVRIGRNIAERIALLKSVDTMPLLPHYLRFDDMKFRAQSQYILDNNGGIALELDYMLSRDSDASRALMEKMLGRIAVERKPTSADSVYYSDESGRRRLMCRLDELLVDFHVPGDDVERYDRLDIEGIYKRIKGVYEEAKKKFADKGGKDGKKAEEAADERATNILEYIRIGMSDVPIGFYVHPETITKTFQSKYPGTDYDGSELLKAFVKDTMNPDPKSDREVYENLKLIICFNAEYKQASAEIQIREESGNYEAEFGAATHDILRAEKEKRKTKPTPKLTEQDMKMKLAFFGSGEESGNALSEIYGNYYIKRISDAIGRIAIMDSIDSIPANAALFEELSDVITSGISSAKSRAGAKSLEEAILLVDGLWEAYALKKGLGVLSYADSLVAIDEMLSDLSGSHGVSLTYSTDPLERSSRIHQLHIRLLFDAFTKLASSKNVNHAAASLFMGQLIKNYDGNYPECVPSGILKGYKKGVNDLWAQNGWSIVKIGNKEAGRAPSAHFIRNRIYKAVEREDAIINTLRSNPFMNFDESTLSNVVKIYRGIANRKAGKPA